MSHPQEIVSKLWRLCNILRDSGITYPEYVTELTYLLFLKMAQETGSEKELPDGFRWADLTAKSGPEQFEFYAELLSTLGTKVHGMIREIFEGAQTCLNKPKHLHLLISELDSINWYAAKREEALADLYEGLLQKNSTESKSGAGQYFTPRAVIESIVQVIKPQAKEIIQDPACGTAGFLIAADRYIKSFPLASSAMTFQRKKAFYGVELVRDTHRLALMNALLHGIEGRIICGDTLDDAGASLPLADVILTNPPFGTKRGGGPPTRLFPTVTSNKQLAFLQHVYLGLKPGGRAAVVMPELLGATASAVCSDLMDHCRVHTVLRLPTGIFYAPGVKTNVLFFERSVKRSPRNTTSVWVYDLRSNMPVFGKRSLLTQEHFADFQKAYGNDPLGRSKRIDYGCDGRFRKFSREQVKERGNTFNISWLRDEDADGAKESQDPSELLATLFDKLNSATRELRSLQNDLNKPF